MTQILPFIMFGIGLDDAFIIAGQYARTDRFKTPEERVHDTIEAVGMSISLTTITSIVAFGLGMLSSVPAVKFLCAYAIPTIFIDFLYQVTFFVALIVLDERRTLDGRLDCVVCCQGRRANDDERAVEPSESIFDHFMRWLGVQLCRRWVAALVLGAFTVLFAFCGYSASRLTREFQTIDLLPSNSYLRVFWNNYGLYVSPGATTIEVIFRDVNESDPLIQEQMTDFVDDLVALPQISSQPTYFWVRDFQNFVNETLGVQNLTFTDQLDHFLGVPVYQSLYKDHIVRDETGEVTASRTLLSVDQLKQGDTVALVEWMGAQRHVSDIQPANRNREDWAFFTHASIYYIWEFHERSPSELRVSAILAVLSVTLLTAALVPHWSAAFFVFPLISILYVDLMGVLQVAGVSINSLSYVSLGEYLPPVRCISSRSPYMSQRHSHVDWPSRRLLDACAPAFL